jgi:hypothetical protein
MKYVQEEEIRMGPNSSSLRHLSRALLISESGLFERNNLVCVVQPPYSLNLASSGFWLFGHLKSSLAGCRFNVPDELLEGITAILDKVPRGKVDHVFMEWIARVRSAIDTNGGDVREYSRLSD